MEYLNFSNLLCWILLLSKNSETKRHIIGNLTTFNELLSKELSDSYYSLKREQDFLVKSFYRELSLREIYFRERFSCDDTRLSYSTKRLMKSFNQDAYAAFKECWELPKDHKNEFDSNSEISINLVTENIESLVNILKAYCDIRENAKNCMDRKLKEYNVRMTMIYLK